MKNQMKIIMLVSALAMLAGVFAYGYHKGSLNELAKVEAKRVKTQEKLFDLAESLSMQSAELLRLQTEKKGLIYELEQAAEEATGAGNPGVGANGGLQRLERRWGPSTASP